jgi:hypothetical protein
MRGFFRRSVGFVLSATTGAAIETSGVTGVLTKIDFRKPNNFMVNPFE